MYFVEDRVMWYGNEAWVTFVNPDNKSYIVEYRKDGVWWQGLALAGELKPRA